MGEEEKGKDLKGDGSEGGRKGEGKRLQLIDYLFILG